MNVDGPMIAVDGCLCEWYQAGDWGTPEEDWPRYVTRRSPDCPIHTAEEYEALWALYRAARERATAEARQEFEDALAKPFAGWRGRCKRKRTN